MSIGFVKFNETQGQGGGFIVVVMPRGVWHLQCAQYKTKRKKKKKTYVHLKGLGQFRLGKRHPKAKHMQPERTFGDK